MTQVVRLPSLTAERFEASQVQVFTVTQVQVFTATQEVQVRLLLTCVLLRS